MTEFRLPWADLPPIKQRTPKAAASALEPPQTAAAVRLRQADKKRARAATLSAAHISVTDPAAAGDVAWQWWHLVVHGPAAEVDSFAAAARGAGIIPWVFDRDQLQEDVFALAIGDPQRTLSVAGCRLLARQFRDAAEARHMKSQGRIGRATTCPFDLQALLPVPPSLLRLGPTHPDTDRWLRQHWGINEHPRQVTLLAERTAGRRLPGGHASVVYGFFTEGPAPDPAIAALRLRWPALLFRLDRCPMT